MRIVLLLGLITLLASCGGRSSSSRTPKVSFASGPIQSACERAGRKSASRALCGCVQAVANRALSDRDQTRAAAFFSNPQRAQDTRQADGAASEAFWKRYRAFADSAATNCRSA